MDVLFLFILCVIMICYLSYEFFFLFKDFFIIFFYEMSFWNDIFIFKEEFWVMFEWYDLVKFVVLLRFRICFFFVIGIFWICEYLFLVWGFNWWDWWKLVMIKYNSIIFWEIIYVCGYNIVWIFIMVEIEIEIVELGWWVVVKYLFCLYVVKR